MKFTSKSILSLLLVVAMMLTFAACGEGKTNTDLGDDDGWDIAVSGNGSGGNVSDALGNLSTPTTSNNSIVQQVKDADSLSYNQLVAQMPKELKGTTIHIYSWNPIKDVTGAQKVIDDFQKKTGIKVKWTQGNYEQYETNIAAFINAGTAPDVMRYNCASPAKMYLCQDMRAATGYDFNGAIWDANIRKEYTIKNKLYGINLQNTFNQQPWIVAYAKSTIDRYNFEDPYTLWKEGKWTFDKMKEMCLEFKQTTTRPAWMTSNHLDLVAFRGLSWIKFDGTKYTSNIKDPQILKTLQEHTTMRQAQDIISTTMRDHATLEDGTYLFFTDNIIGQRRTDFHYTTLKANNDLYCVPFPTQTGYTYYQPYHEAEAYGIIKGAKNPSAVYYYLRYYLNADNYDEDMFFTNAQALEVYKWCRSQKNVVFGCAGELTKAIGNQHGDLPSTIRTGLTAEQVKNKLDEIENVYVRAAQYGNDLIAKF